LSTIAISTPQKVTKFGWVEETTKGQIPANAAFNDVLAQEFNPGPTIEHVEQAALGTPYLHAIEKLGERYNVPFTYIPFDSDLLMYFINRTGTKNIDKSLTFGVGHDLNNAGTLQEHFYFAKGCQCDSVTVTIANDSVLVETELVALDVSTPSTSHGITGTPTWAPLTLAGWTGLAGGVDPIQWNALPQKVRGGSITVNNAIDRIQFVGDSTLSYAQPTTHRVEGTLDIVWKDSTLLSDVKTFTKRACKIQLGPACFITLTNAVFHEAPWSLVATETTAMTVSYTLKAVKAEITTV
jgi:hypothetical protein